MLLQTTAPTARTTPPIADSFIGQKVIKINLSTYGYVDDTVHVTDLYGNKAGYSSVQDALDAARQLQTGAHHTTVGFAVLRPAGQDKFALAGLDSSLLYNVNGTVYKVPGYKTYTDAVAAVMNGNGYVMSNDGPSGWWN